MSAAEPHDLDGGFLPLSEKGPCISWRDLDTQSVSHSRPRTDVIGIRTGSFYNFRCRNRKETDRQPADVTVWGQYAFSDAISYSFASLELARLQRWHWICIVRNVRATCDH